MIGMVGPPYWNSSQRVVSNKTKDIAVCRDLLKVVHVEKFLSPVLATVKAESKQPLKKVLSGTDVQEISKDLVQ